MPRNSRSRPARSDRAVILFLKSLDLSSIIHHILSDCDSLTRELGYESRLGAAPGPRREGQDSWQPRKRQRRKRAAKRSRPARYRKRGRTVVPFFFVKNSASMIGNLEWAIEESGIDDRESTIANRQSR